MNKVYCSNQAHFFLDVGDVSENIKKLKTEFAENFCLTFFEEDSFLLILKITIKLNKDLYEPLVNLYKNAFEEDFLLKDDDIKFLTNVYSAKPVFLENAGFTEYLYLIFQNFALEVYNQKG